MQTWARRILYERGVGMLPGGSIDANEVLLEGKVIRFVLPSTDRESRQGCSRLKRPTCPGGIEGETGAEDNLGEARGILVTWYGPWSYTMERSAAIPAGMTYECLADDNV